MRGSDGRLEELRRRALLDHLPRLHHDQTVCNLVCEPELVRDDHHRCAGDGECRHQPEHLPDHFRVERRGRLVEQNQLRVHRKRPGDRDPLLLPTRERVRMRGSQMSEADLLEQALSLRRESARLSPRMWCGASAMLLSAVRCGNSSKCWNTIPIRRR